jgi:hypothetical protein
LTSKNPQYAMIPFTSKNLPSTNKLWDHMRQVVVKANGEWVRLDVEVDSKGRCGGGWQGANQDSVHVRLHQAHLLQYLHI